mmetsp:Transcript_3128/g.11675  ORF Transcript_3128/g.11675 Transcript_3128/m.11675 type:complete len:215 (-) Transcript_3128:6031-6675(-)
MLHRRRVEQRPVVPRLGPAVARVRGGPERREDIRQRGVVHIVGDGPPPLAQPEKRPGDEFKVRSRARSHVGRGAHGPELPHERLQPRERVPPVPQRPLVLDVREHNLRPAASRAVSRLPRRATRRIVSQQPEQRPLRLPRPTSFPVEAGELEPRRRLLRGGEDQRSNREERLPHLHLSLDAVDAIAPHASNRLAARRDSAGVERTGNRAPSSRN